MATPDTTGTSEGRANDLIERASSTGLTMSSANAIGPANFGTWLVRVGLSALSAGHGAWVLLAETPVLERVVSLDSGLHPVRDLNPCYWHEKPAS